MDNASPPSIGNIPRKIRETLKTILDFKFLIDKEKQGLKSNIFIDIVVMVLGSCLVLIGRMLFWSRGDQLFGLFETLFFVVIGFLILCYCYFALKPEA